MTTPPDPAQGQPNPGPYGPPPGSYGTGYGGVQYPYPGDQGQPHGQPPAGYPYNPYGYPGYQYPAGLDDKASPPAARPRMMIVGLVLLILSAVPSLLGGAVIATGIVDNAALGLSPAQAAEFEATGLDLAAMMQGVGVFVAALSGVFILMSVLAFTGRHWARVLVAVMTVGFLLAIIGSLLLAPSDPTTIVVGVIPIAAALVGVGMYFATSSNEFFAASSR